MRIGFISQGAVGAFLKTYEEEKTDILLFCLRSLGEVSYEKELKGETAYFEDVARLSKKAKSTVVCGCITDTKGHKRESVIVAENGRIAGVSDRINAIDGEIGSSAGLRIYPTNAGRMGIVVGEDLRFPEVLRALSTCGSDFIVCPFATAGDKTLMLIRAHAYCYGIPVLLCADGYCAVADTSGNIAFSSPQSPSFVDIC